MNRTVFKTLGAKAIALISIVAIPLISTLSCTIGLGEAVDVSAPTLSISYPPSGAIIRESFFLTGDCNDDGVVSKVHVDVKNNNTGAAIYSGDARIEGKTWIIELNTFNSSAYESTNGWQYADGTYEVAVVATDASGKSSGVASRTFDIDNTAPFFIIQKPGVTVASGKSASPYGTTFSINGTIADLHEISLMALDVYNKDGTKKIASSENFYQDYVPTAGGTSLDFAKSDDDGSADYSRYVTLYCDGESDKSLEGKSETKYYSCTVTLSDAAKVYRNPGDSGEGKGNTTTEVYLYDDVYQSYLSSTRGLGLSASSLMNISNGTETNGSLDKAALKSKAVNTASFEEKDNRLAFSLNPAANPTYVVSGLSIFTEEKGVYKTPDSNQVANTSNVTVSVSAGLNNTAVKPESIHLWLLEYPSYSSTEDRNSNDSQAKSTRDGFVKKFTREIVESRRNKLENDPEYTSEIFINEVIEKAKSSLNVDVWCVKDNSDSNASSGTMLTVAFQMPSVIKLDKYYLIVATGADLDGLEFSQDSLFGFRGTGTGKLPSVKVTEPANLSLKATSQAKDKTNNGLTFSGTAENGDTEVDYISVEIKVTDEETNSHVGTITGIIPQSKMTPEAPDENGEVHSYHWSFSPSESNFSQAGYADAKCEPGDGKAYLYEATFKVYDKGGQESSVNDAVHIDTVNPVVNITSITPVISDYAGDKGRSFVNGDITIKGNVEETNLTNVVARLYVEGNLTDVKQSSGDLGKAFSFSIPGTSVSGTTIPAFDTKKIVNNDADDGAKNMVIVITATDAVGNVGETTSNIYNHNVLGRAEGESITVNQLTDKPVIRPTNFEKIGETEEIKAGKNLFGISTNNQMKFTVEDDDGSVAGDMINVWAFESGKPHSEENKKNLDISGNAIDLSSLDEGKYEVFIWAKDKNYKSEAETPNNFAVESYRIALTAGAPKISFAGSTGACKDGDTVHVKGTLTNLSKTPVTVKVKRQKADGTYEYLKDESGNAKDFTVPGRTAEGVAGTVTFEEDIVAAATTPGAERESVSVVYSVEDEYGQTESDKFTYVVDNKAPSLNVTAVTPEVANASGRPFVNGTISVTFNASDNYDLAEVRYEVYEAAEETAMALVTEGPDESPKVKFDDDGNVTVTNGTKVAGCDGLFDDEHTIGSCNKFGGTFEIDTRKVSNTETRKNILIVMTAKDMAGNRYCVNLDKDLSYIVDQTTDKPNVSPSNFVLCGNNEIVSGKNLFGLTSNNILLGGLSDDDGLKEATAYYRKASAYNADGSAVFSDEFSFDSLEISGEPTSKNLSQKLPEEEGKYEIYFVVKDKFYVDDSSTPYNYAESKHYYVGVSGGSPTISIVAPPSNSYTSSYTNEKNQGKLSVSGKALNFNGTSTAVIRSVVRTAGSDHADTDLTVEKTDAEKLKYNNNDNDNAKGSFTETIYPVTETTETTEVKEKAVVYTVTDIFGQTASASITYKLDNTAPVIKSASDIASAAPGDLKIGGSYFVAETKWYKGTDISIEGQYMDAGSGISEINYVLVPHGKEDAEGNRVKGTIVATRDGETNNYKFKGTVSGYEAGKNNRLKLYAVDAVGNRSDDFEKTVWMDEESPEFSAEFVSLDAGKTASSASGTVTVNGRQNVVLYGTIRDPQSGIGEVSADKVLDVKIRKASGGESESESALAHTLLFREDSADLTDWTNVPGTSETYKTYSEITDKTKISGWKISVTAADLNSALGSGNKIGTLTVTTVDKAGNKFYNSSVLTFSVDDVAPTVEYSTSRDNVNGTIDIEGRVEETVALFSMDLYYATGKDAPTVTGNPEDLYLDSSKNLSSYGWKKFGETITDIAKIYSWNFKNFDFNTLSGAIDRVDADDVYESGKGTIWILPHVKDKAGNTSAVKVETAAGGTKTFSWNATKFNVDVNADRPVIQVTNLSRQESTVDDKTVYKYNLINGTDAQINGTVTDDDGEIEAGAFIISDTQIAVDASGNVTSPVTGTTTLNGSDWTFTPSDKGDGSKDVYFYVKDKKGKWFYTGNADSGSFYRPYFKFKSEDYKTEKDDSLSAKALHYISDCNSPEIDSVELIAYKTNEDGAPANGDATTVNTGVFVGGTEKKFVEFRIKSHDANEIAGMTLEIKGPSKTMKLWKDMDGKTLNSKYSEGFTKDTGTFVYGKKKDASGIDTDADDTRISIWTTGKIDMSQFGTGEVTITVLAYDKCDLKQNSPATFYVDNTAPTVSNIEPSKTEEKTGDIVFKGIADDSSTGRSGLASVKYLVPDVSQRGKSDAELAGDVSVWGGNTILNGSWMFTFDGADTSGDKKKFTKEFAETYKTKKENGIYTIPIYVKVEDVLGNFHIEKHEIKYNPDADKPVTRFTYPKKSDCTEGTEADGKYVTLGGLIRATGSASIPSMTTSVSSVYMQIDVDNDGDFDTVDYAALEAMKKSGSSDKIFTMAKINDGDGGARDESLIVEGLDTAEERKAWWGIKCDLVGSAWGLNLNEEGEFNPTGDGTKDIRLRVCGINAEKKVGAWSEDIIEIHVDSKAPQGTCSLIETDSSTSTSDVASVTPNATRAYEAGMFLKGHWWLVVDIFDESGIKGDEIAVKKGLEVYPNWTKVKYDKNYSGSDKDAYKVYVKVDPSAGATYTVTAKDMDGGNGATSKTFTGTYTVAVDNKAPIIGDIKSGDEIIGKDYTVRDSSYQFTIDNMVTDETGGSGFDYVLFFFGRSDASGNNAAYLDPVKVAGESTSFNKVTTYDTESISVVTGSASRSLANIDLYGKRHTGTQSTKSDFTVSETLDKHIRAGGLVKIGGVYRTIASIDGKKVTFTPETADTSADTAFFVYGQTANNDSKRESFNGSFSQNPYNIKNDDGDGILESINKTTGVWSATLRSGNLPDGNATLYVLAWDKAANVAMKKVNVFVSNNAPRIAKVYLGTDIDDNKEFEASEFEEYSWYSTDGFAEKFYLKTEGSGRKPFAIKGSLAVVPEIIGGNGKINMVMNKAPASVTVAEGAVNYDTVTPTKSDDGTAITEGAEGYTLSPSATATDLDSRNATYSMDDGKTPGFKKFVVSKETLTDLSIADGTGKPLSFTFWDSTDGRTIGVDSQCAVIYVSDFTVDLRDEKKPNVVIHKFKWNGKDDNSLYSNSAKFGHIELEADWKLSTGYLDSNSLDSKLKDEDPKVSGKIVIRGTAYDDVCLKNLWLNLDDFAFKINGTAYSQTKTIDGKTYIKVGEYENATKKWTMPRAVVHVASDGASGEGSGAGGAGGDGGASSGPTFEDEEDAAAEVTYTDKDGWSFRIITDISASDKNFVKNDDSYFGQKGHKVAWEFSIDTSKINNNVKLDADVIVRAEDTTGNITLNSVNTSNKTGVDKDAEERKPSYKMDIVPYITTIETGLSNKNLQYPTANSRTAKGHYTVRGKTKVSNRTDTDNDYVHGEIIRVKGFNIGSNRAKLAGSPLVSAKLSYETVDGVNSYQVKKTDLTGKWDLTVSDGTNDINALNNYNYNDARGSFMGTTSSKTGDKDVYDNWYNRQPNGYNNNNLTDDVEFDVWQFNSRAVQPISGKIEQPHMKINPVTGQIGFAFVNGPLYFSMPGRAYASSANAYDIVDKSYNYWCGSYDFFTSVGLAYDNDGRSYAVAAGGDINSDAADKFVFFTDRFDTRNRKQRGAYEAKIRLESIGQRTADDVNNYDKQRIKSPSLAATSGTGVYLAYYDQMNKEIRFMKGSSTTNTYNITNIDIDDWSFDKDYGTTGVKKGLAHAHIANVGKKLKNGDRVDIYNARGKKIISNMEVFNAAGEDKTWFTVKGNNFDEVTIDGRTASRGVPPEANGGFVVNLSRTSDLTTIFADHDIQGYPLYYKNDHVQIISANDAAKGKSGTKAGQYVSIAAIPGATPANDVVVMVWYDESNNCLWYTYNGNLTDAIRGDTAGTGWSTPVRVFASSKSYGKAGQFAQIAVDKDGGIHIAAYDPLNADLVYAYKSSAAGGTFKTYVVDSSGTVGDNITIDVAMDNGRISPQIGYYSAGGTLPKIAKLAVPGVVGSGVVNDVYTGTWECSYVPSGSTINTQSNQYNKVNIGLWKTSGGEIDKSKTGSSTGYNSINGYSKTVSYGDVWGNGTKNAVLGYAVMDSNSNDYIETAQMLTSE